MSSVEKEVVRQSDLSYPERLQRLNRAIELRTRGWGWQRIADELKWATYQAAQKAVQDELNRRWKNGQMNVDFARQEQSETIDALVERMWAIIENSDPDTQMKAADRINRLLERRSRLMGLDSETKVNVDGGVRVELVGVDLNQL